MPQLDSVRTIAILLVLAAHFCDLDRLPLGFGLIWWGGLGVYLFFVLSGFLITGILLDCRDAMDAGKTSWRFAARHFYARRSLRIFPLYYAILFAGLLFNVPDAWSHWPSLMTFTFNFSLARSGWTPYFLPFWSLSVEEQFYLVWPWCVLLLRRRMLPVAIGLLLFIGPAWRFAADLLDWNFILRSCATPGCLDLLGAGAFLALRSRTQSEWDRTHHVLARLAAPAAVVGFIFSPTFSMWIGGSTTMYWASPVLYAVPLSWIVSAAGRGTGGVAGAALDLPGMQYIGRISYGIYACHLFIAVLVAKVMWRLSLTVPENGWVKFLLMTMASVVAAGLSWHFFEEPLNRLKRLFPYVPARNASCSRSDVGTRP